MAVAFVVSLETEEIFVDVVMTALAALDESNNVDGDDPESIVVIFYMKNN